MLLLCPFLKSLLVASFAQELKLYHSEDALTSVTLKLLKCHCGSIEAKCFTSTLEGEADHSHHPVVKQPIQKTVQWCFGGCKAVQQR